MKKLILLFVLSVLTVSCVTKTKGNDGENGTKGQDSKAITITSADVEEIVDYLASDELKGRNTGTEGIEKSAQFIASKFKANAIKPYFETYRDNFMVETSKDTLNAFNVVGYIEGNDPKLKNEFVIIGAHYDHIGYGKKVENDSIANGANDNATGTAAVMSVARYLAAKKANKRSVMFVLFSAEEMGLKGSNHLAKKLKDQNLNLYTMINFEMIGAPFKDRNYKAFLTGYEMSNMADVINKSVKDTLIGFSEVSKKYSLFKRSDNYGFFQEFNVPCHTISSFDMTNYEYYHHVDDESALMDYEFMANLINALNPAISSIINSNTREIVLKNDI